MTENEIQTVRSEDGTSIAFDLAGSGPPLVLVDPAGGFRGFGPTAALAGHLTSSFTVLTYDRRGRGESGDSPIYHPQREVEDLHALIEAVGGRSFVYGFSSGAILALEAVKSGLAVDRLALMEPPIDVDEDPIANQDPLADEIAEMVADGRRGDAFIHFNESIGVPEEMLAGLKEGPAWPALKALAHTLVYDLRIAASFHPASLSAIAAPTLVVLSQSSDSSMRERAAAVADAMPNGHMCELPGEWHGVAPDILAPALTDFLVASPRSS